MIKFWDDKKEVRESQNMITIPLKEAQERLPELICNLKLRDELIITEKNQPVAKLVIPVALWVLTLVLMLLVLR